MRSGYASRPPDADAIEEGRRYVKFVAKKLGEGTSRVLKLQMLLLLAEGKAEDALGPATKLQLAVDGKQWEGEKKGWQQKYELVRTPETDDGPATQPSTSPAPTVVWDPSDSDVPSPMCSTQGRA